MVDQIAEMKAPVVPQGKAENIKQAIKGNVEAVSTAIGAKTEAGQKALKDRVDKIPTLADTGNPDSGKGWELKNHTPKGITAEAQTLISAIIAGEDSKLIRSEKTLVVAGGTIQMAIDGVRTPSAEKTTLIKTMAGQETAALKTMVGLEKTEKYDYTKLQSDADKKAIEVINKLQVLESSPNPDQNEITKLQGEYTMSKTRRDYFGAIAERNQLFDVTVDNAEDNPYNFNRTPRDLIQNVLMDAGNIAQEAVDPIMAENRMRNLVTVAQNKLKALPNEVVDSNNSYLAYRSDEWNSAGSVINTIGEGFKKS